MLLGNDVNVDDLLRFLRHGGRELSLGDEPDAEVMSLVEEMRHVSLQRVLLLSQGGCRGFFETLHQVLFKPFNKSFVLVQAQWRH